MTPDSAPAPWRATVMTLFPEMFPGPLGASLPGKALANGLWSLEMVDIRDFASNKHRTVDDAPFGGGPGMVMRPDVLAAAIDATATGGEDEALIYLSPRGAPLTQARVREFSALRRLVLVCGRFEGVDERVIQARNQAIANDMVIEVEGEPGTGKRLIAEALHQQSRRREGPFVVYDCGDERDPRRVEAALQPGDPPIRLHAGVHEHHDGLGGGRAQELRRDPGEGVSGDGPDAIGQHGVDLRGELREVPAPGALCEGL